MLALACTVTARSLYSFESETPIARDVVPRSTPLFPWGSSSSLHSSLLRHPVLFASPRLTRPLTNEFSATALPQSAAPSRWRRYGCVRCEGVLRVRHSSQSPLWTRPTVCQWRTNVEGWLVRTAAIRRGKPRRSSSGFHGVGKNSVYFPSGTS